MGAGAGLGSFPEVAVFPFGRAGHLGKDGLKNTPPVHPHPEDAARGAGPVGGNYSAFLFEMVGFLKKKLFPSSGRFISLQRAVFP